MTYKIPPSLKWLIDKHARISGKVAKLKKRLASVEDLVLELNDLEKQLLSVEEMLKIHDIQIDISLIKPRRPYPKRSERKIRFANGQAGKLLMNFINKKTNPGIIHKLEAVDLLMQRHLEIDPTPLSRSDFQEYVNQVLNRLTQSGFLQRLHNPITNKGGTWQIHPDYASKDSTNL